MPTARTLRPVLKAVILIGLLIIPIGPCARAGNEGFGGPPGPIQVSDYWQQVSYILIPAGAGIAFLAAVALVVIDRKQSKDQ